MEGKERRKEQMNTPHLSLLAHTPETQTNLVSQSNMAQTQDNQLQCKMLIYTMKKTVNKKAVHYLEDMCSLE